MSHNGRRSQGSSTRESSASSHASSFDTTPTRAEPIISPMAQSAPPGRGHQRTNAMEGLSEPLTHALTRANLYRHNQLNAMEADATEKWNSSNQPPVGPTTHVPSRPSSSHSSAGSMIDHGSDDDDW